MINFKSSLIPERLEFIIDLLDLKQKEFGSKLGFGPNFATEILKGRAGLSPGAAGLIEREFGVNRMWLTGDIDQIFLKTEKGIKKAVEATKIIEKRNKINNVTELLIIIDCIIEAYRNLQQDVSSIYIDKMLNVIDYINGISNRNNDASTRFRDRIKNNNTIIFSVAYDVSILLRDVVTGTKLTDEQILKISKMIVPRAFLLAKRAANKDKKCIIDVTTLDKIDKTAKFSINKASKNITIFGSCDYNRGFEGSIRINMGDNTLLVDLKTEDIYELIYVFKQLVVKQPVQAGNWQGKLVGDLEIKNNILTIIFSPKLKMELIEFIAEICKDENFVVMLTEIYAAKFGVI